MIVKYEFAIRKGATLADYDFEKIEERRRMDDAPHVIGKMVVDKVKFTHVSFREQDLYKTEAVVFSMEDWASFCNQLRANIPLGLIAPGLVDDLIQQLESK